MHRLGLNRAAYLGDPDVQSFIDWLVGATQPHGFVHAWGAHTPAAPWACTDIVDACKQYNWPFAAVPGVPAAPAGNNFAQNYAALNALGAQLSSATNDVEMRDACINVFSWGGVSNGNTSWVNSNLIGIHALVNGVRTQLAGILAGGPVADLVAPIRFNSGMSKVYALLVSGLIIYDSRVTAALGLAVQRWANACRRAVPSTLLFPWMPGRGVPNRDPGAPFPQMNSVHLRHAWSAVYASMVLGEVARHAGGSLRQMEAALFMIGYDIPAPAVASNASLATPSERLALDSEDRDAQDCPAGWNRSFTAGHGRAFCWTFVENECAFHHQPNANTAPQLLITVVELLDMLRCLETWFPGGHFPLSNDAANVPAGNAPLGIGRAFFEATGRAAPHSSRVTAIFEDIGLLHRHAGYPATWSLSQAAKDLLTPNNACNFVRGLVFSSSSGA